MAQEIINGFGGPSRCISIHATADRRFLVEQLAILDLIGMYPSLYPEADFPKAR